MEKVNLEIGKSLIAEVPICLFEVLNDFVIRSIEGKNLPTPAPMKESGRGIALLVPYQPLGVFASE